MCAAVSESVAAAFENIAVDRPSSASDATVSQDVPSADAITRFVAAIAAATSVCHAVQNTAATLQASLVQASIAYDAFASWLSELPSQVVRFPATEIAPKVGARLAALRAEAAVIEGLLADLSGAHVGFIGEACQWARASPPEAFMSFESQMKPEGNLAEVSRFDHASRERGFADALTAVCSRHPETTPHFSEVLQSGEPTDATTLPVVRPPKDVQASRWEAASAFPPPTNASRCLLSKLCPNGTDLRIMSSTSPGPKILDPCTQLDLLRVNLLRVTPSPVPVPSKTALARQRNQRDGRKHPQLTSNIDFELYQTLIAEARQETDVLREQLEQKNAEVAIFRARALYAAWKIPKQTSGAESDGLLPRSPSRASSRPGTREGHVRERVANDFASDDATTLAKLATFETLGSGDKIPTEAVRCWQMLTKAGLTTQERAQVLAMSRGVLKISIVTRSLQRWLQGHDQRRRRPIEPNRMGAGVARAKVAENMNVDSSSDGARQDEFVARRSQTSSPREISKTKNKVFAPHRVSQPPELTFECPECPDTTPDSPSGSPKGSASASPSFKTTRSSRDSERRVTLQQNHALIQQNQGLLTEMQNLRSKLLRSEGMCRSLQETTSSTEGGQRSQPPEKCGVTVKQVADFRDRVMGPLQEYKSEHETCMINGRLNHVCLSEPCDFDHGCCNALLKSLLPLDAALDKMRCDMHLVEEKIIKSETSYTNGRPLALDWNPQGLQVTTFVSHFYGEKFKDFVDTLLIALPPDESVFISAFSVSPWEVATDEWTKAEGGLRIVDLCSRAIQHGKQVLAVIDRDFQFPRRLWCSWEICHASKFEKLTLIWPSHTSNLNDLERLFQSPGDVNFETTVPEDHQMLTDLISTTVGMKHFATILRLFIGDRLSYICDTFPLEDRQLFSANFQMVNEERFEAFRSLNESKAAPADGQGPGRGIRRIFKNKITKPEKTLYDAVEQQLSQLCREARKAQVAVHLKADRYARNEQARRESDLSCRFASISRSIQGLIDQPDICSGICSAFEFQLLLRKYADEFEALVENSYKNSEKEEDSDSSVEACSSDSSLNSEVEDDPVGVQVDENERMTVAFTTASNDCDAKGEFKHAAARLAESTVAIRKLRSVRISMFARQDDGYQTLGVGALLKAGEKQRIKFEKEIRDLAAAHRGIPALHGPKAFARYCSKALAKCNDSRCFVGVLRAGIAFDDVDVLYTALLNMIDSDISADRADFFFVDVKDHLRNFPACESDSVNVHVNINGLIGKISLYVISTRRAWRQEKIGRKKKRRAAEAILLATARGEEHHVTELLKKFPDVIVVPIFDNFGRSPLHNSCQLGQIGAVESLIQARADPWASDNCGVLALELAMKGLHFQTAARVLSHMHATYTMGNSAALRLARELVPWLCDHVVYQAASSDLDLDVGVKARHKSLPQVSLGRDLIKLLHGASEKYPIDVFFLDSARSGRVSRVRILMTFGVDVVPGFLQPSALDLAIECGHSAVAQFLIERGKMYPGNHPKCTLCNKKSINEHLRHAADHGDVTVATAALDVGANPCATQTLGAGKRTVLMSFAAAGNFQMCERLVQSRGLAGRIDEFRFKASHYALALGHKRLADMLADREAEEPTKLDELDIQTPSAQLLHDAINVGCCAAVWLVSFKTDNRAAMVGSGVDVGYSPVVSLSGPGGKTPLHRSLEQSCLETDPSGMTCRSLLMCKSDPTIVDDEGNSALHMVAMAKDVQLYDEVYSAVKKWFGNDVKATDEHADADNCKGQVASRLIESVRLAQQRRTGNQRDSSIRQQRGNHLLMRVGFTSFRLKMLESRLDSWRLANACTLLEILGIGLQDPDIRRNRLKEGIERVQKHDEDEESLALSAQKALKHFKGPRGTTKKLPGILPPRASRASIRVTTQGRFEAPSVQKNS